MYFPSSEFTILPENVPLRSLQAVLSNGFAFCLMWNVLENGYLEPHANTRIDFHRERGKVRQGGRQTWPYLAMAELKFCSEGSRDQS